MRNSELVIERIQGVLPRTVVIHLMLFRQVAGNKYKIFTIPLNNRLSKIVESKLNEAQAGFRPNRSTLDDIFIICQTFEKYHEYNTDLQNIFVGSINRNKVIDNRN